MDEDGLDPEVDDYLSEPRSARDPLPAYSHAHRWGLNVHKALQAYLDKEYGEHPPDPDEPLHAAFANSLTVAAKIAAGHGMNLDGREERCAATLSTAKSRCRPQTRPYGPSRN